MKRLFLYVIAALLAVQGAWAAAPARYELKLRSGQKMRIDVCSDRIFRVRVTPADTFAESLLERYGLLKTDWEPVQVTQRNEGGVVMLGTPACRIRIDRKDGRISVTDLKGNAILREASYLAPGAPLITALGQSLNEKFQKPRRDEAIIGDTTKNGAQQQQTEVGDMSRNSILSFTLADDERFYGGGSTSRDHIQHRGEVLRMWASYQIAEAPIPFMMSSAGWGVFDNTTVRSYFDVARYDKERLLIYNTAPGADFYVMVGGSMPQTLGLYTSLTGRAYVLPRWMYGLSFGGHMQENQFEMMDDAVRFRTEKVPCDVMWIEPQWMSKYYDFSTEKSWNYKLFPPEGYWVEKQFPKHEWKTSFVGRLHGLGYKLGLWLCIDHDQSIVEEDIIAAREGRPQSGKEHWFDHLTNFMDQGVDGFKLDPARTLDEHPDRKYYNGLTDKEMHNLNQVLMPRQMNRVFRDHKGIRPWQHYCGGFAGTQRWTANQSGDNGGERTALFDQLNLGSSGLMNTSCDVMSAKDEMAALHMGVFLPWIQINSWFGLLHPWYFPDKEKAMYRDYIQLRHDLFPYIYSAALNGHLTGMPILRSMPLVYPDDRNVDDMVFQYMFGDNLLIGVFSDSVYLPKGDWIDFWTGEQLRGEGKEIRHAIPDNRAGLAFVKVGAILPMQKPVQYIGERPLDTLILKVYPSGNSSYTLYEDDGVTFDYEQGKIAKTVFDCRQSGGRTELVVNPAEGDYNGMYPARVYEVEMRLASRPGSVTIDGVKTDAWSYGDGLLKVTVNQPDVRKKSVLVAE
ncbi:glycoside hydrolase family 31 protein [Alistipes indistinctus]|uniref:glycoside hydrolase family 31 protein n=1 Tax=Alistipes indistinctus TaxID=626932 RepID=UPI002676BC8C|nr:TIM-barrel domain-containing protein [Alistipes indistinctus]